MTTHSLTQTDVEQRRQTIKAKRETAENLLREADDRLQENLRLLDTQRRKLNANLRRRPFHGQY